MFGFSSAIDSVYLSLAGVLSFDNHGQACQIN